MPFVIHPSKNVLQSLSLFALELWVHNLSIHAAFDVAELVFQHFLVPLIPLKLAHVAYTP